ncbi:MAG: hypothetical protein WBX18_08355, partial [Terracidiphilus sp.]
MLNRASPVLLLCLLLLHGSSASKPERPHLRFAANGDAPKIIALYEAWFGLSKHIEVGYSSHDPAVIKKQIQHAKALGISAFVVDWYGDREPYIDSSYALMQKLAA